MKTCNICGETKQSDKFAKNRNQCKLCRSRQAKKHKNDCAHCGAFFFGEKGAVYCSVKCRSDVRVKRTEVACDYCGSVLEIKDHQKIHNNHYCNRICHGKHRSETTKGIKNPRYNRVTLYCLTCEESFSVIPYYKDSRKYCSSDCAQSHMVGSNHPRYNHNMSDEERIQERDYPEYNSWRRSVFERDSYRCYKCEDDRGGNLVAHHIFNFSSYEDLRTDLDNGITLCECCHINFHKIYGYYQNDIKQLSEYMKDKPIPSEVVEKLTKRVETNLVV